MRPPAVPRRTLLSLVCCVLVVLAGCSTVIDGGTPTTGTTNTTGTMSQTQTTTASPPVPLSTAKDRALAAEEARVDALIANATNVSGGAPGGTSTPRATVLNVTETAVVLEVRMSYGYEYSCPELGGGAVDGSTHTVYRVTENDTALVEIREPVALLCN